MRTFCEHLVQKSYEMGSWGSTAGQPTLLEVWSARSYSSRPPLPALPPHSEEARPYTTSVYTATPCCLLTADYDNYNSWRSQLV